MTLTPTTDRWWRRQTHQDRRPLLLARGAIKRAMRAWFDVQGFTEVETTALQVSPGNEAHLHAFATEQIGPDGQRTPLYLHTSPEFACKKLLAGGETKIFEFAPVFRNRERGALHHPQFTMVEWYRVGDGYEQLMADCQALLAVAADAAGSRALSFRGRRADPRAPLERVTVAEAFERFAGIDLMASLAADGAPDLASLAAQASAAHIRTADDDTWSDIFSRILVEKVEPHLGDGSAVLLCDYPACEAALARRKPDDTRLAERFELFACGVELTNAFGELTDPAEQRRRFEAEMDEKARLYGERYPIDEDFLAALAEMPPAAGAALGFDRLVMLLLGAPRIDDVIWTPMP